MLDTFTSISTEETEEIAKNITPLVLQSKIVALTGQLGSGKTFMCSHIIRELCKDFNETVTSPTFNILKTYNSQDLGTIYHYDLYRIKNIAEIEEIGLAEILNAKSSICLIEWPEIIAPMLPRGTLHIDIEHVEDVRTITIQRD